MVDWEETIVLFNRSKDKIFYQTMVDATTNIIEAVQLFRENVETLEEKEQYAERLKELEHKGDDYTHLVIQELNKAFVTPLDHEDILKLVYYLDDVLDGIEACAARFVYMHVNKTTPYLIQYGEILEKSARQLQEAFVALEKRDYDTIRRISVEINSLENEGDKLMRESISALFEEAIDPIELIKMKEIYQKLEGVTDSFEDVMDVMESVVMKYA
ncbi:MAG: DUF47 domain-containing protein [Thermoactinomyces vulgaris]|jgi:uncharacterized protein|uniref:DUF47 domain-containing protein n=1 Tax=Thermoactinomyces vulgaris TaxID=2026 RepID=UPI0009E23754|nr:MULTISPECIES: DUF47 family protein [Thermoactinomyces]QBK13412.1 DUF47 domain-containing protein [Thermoactinomyces vulgaris]